jgi:hypothetical protein
VCPAFASAPDRAGTTYAPAKAASTIAPASEASEASLSHRDIRTSGSPPQVPLGADVPMDDISGATAVELVSTGAGDLVEQLNQAASRVPLPRLLSLPSWSRRRSSKTWQRSFCW